ncbi:MAG: pyruvate formate lyase activating enzyme [Archaeoglobi archaeon]|nr:pyruvate formate lyase activating enzyme [Archaeoglobi archaeon]MDK2782183.1 pyruvate formate lyase activating enzyme [Archaeoglobi archaeon]
MKINLGGLTPISTVDWSRRVSSVVFLTGCPFRCPYCQNHELLEVRELTDSEELLKELDDAKDFIDGVVFSGGEPTGRVEVLEYLIEEVRKRDLAVAVQTNGFYPENLRRILGSVDAVMMDVKTVPEKYDALVRREGALKRVEESLEILRDAEEVEIRTTVFRSLHPPEDVERIARWVPDFPLVLQQGRPENAWSEEIRRERALTRDEILKLAERASKYNKNIKIRTVEFGEEVYEDHSIRREAVFGKERGCESRKSPRHSGGHDGRCCER